MGFLHNHNHQINNNKLPRVNTGDEVAIGNDDFNVINNTNNTLPRSRVCGNNKSDENQNILLHAAPVESFKSETQRHGQTKEVSNTNTNTNTNLNIMSLEDI